MIILKRLFIIIFSLILCESNLSAQGKPQKWPQRVLITNDNGINDVKIIELAKAVAEIAEVYVIAPAENKSSSTHYLSIDKTGQLKVTKVEIAEGINAYAVDGFPADCVVLGVLGIMKDNPPDLIISGINGGDNSGHAWLGSGTIGAARMGAFAGYPSIAVSGLKTSIPGSMEKANEWVVKFVQSDLVRELKPPQYFTVSLPRIPPAEIKGAKIAKRAVIDEFPVITLDEKLSGSGEEIWKITGSRKNPDYVDEGTDNKLIDEDYIVVVPMIADELDYNSVKLLDKSTGKLPAW